MIKQSLAGGTMTGDLHYGDNVKLKFGTGGDLEIYHDGSNSYIDDARYWWYICYRSGTQTFQGQECRKWLKNILGCF